MTTTAGQISARLERLPLSRWHVKTRVLVGVATFFDGFDQLMIAYALPVLIPHFHLSPSSIAWTIAIGGIGMLVGALAGGRAADYLGRVPVLMGSLAVYSLTSLAMVATDTFWLFLVLRFVQGFGLGAEVPVAATYIGEITRAERRGRFVLLFELIFPAGLLAAALVSSWAVPTLGWRWLFALGAVPVLLVPFLRRVPESPRWLAVRGRLDEADAALRRIEAEVAAQRGNLPDPAPAREVRLTRGRVVELFQGAYLRRTIMLAIAWLTAYFVNYGIASWLPTLYGQVFHLSMGTALSYSVATSVAGIFGCLVIALTIDKIGRRAAITAGLIGSALALGILAATGAASATTVLVWSATSAVFIFAVNLALYVYTAELYPTRMRALGCSVGGAIGRVGVVLGPLVVGQLIERHFSIADVFWVMAAVAVVGGVSTAFLAVETRERVLEDISQ
ncbi:MFS transporter [Sinomonas sp. JGH33]|uniref:MFS transporter n=1 Tax=Sinomonas terricola TaxID=3110330 RepID=A0ABU5T2N7_9MICC|nr:MFS transporter [Sinomonas sp. JGH33]MEA5453749.1 MFS transporter [Sinomonas sp. JGH33]